ncbi:ABC transporter substrate-binding protein [Undibacter mobilis]|nr:ABC transporter substrate-binding protein [Undibacter mobilis]
MTSYASRLMKSATAAVFIFAASVIVLGTQHANAQTKVVFGYVSDGALQWPEYVAIEKGWFKENNIDIEMLAVGGGAAQQLAAGALNLSASGFPDYVRATEQGAAIKIVLNGVNMPPYDVYAKPTIKSLPELKGKLVSIGGNKDITLTYVTAAMAAVGMKPTDVDYIYAKSTTARFAALMSGGVDAAILYPPTNFKAAAAGFNKVATISDHVKDIPFIVYGANLDWAKKNGEALRNYMKTYSRALTWLYDKKNKDEAVKILMKHGKVTQQDANDTYDYFIGIAAYSKDGLINDASWKKMADTLIEFGDLPSPAPAITKFVDDSYVKAGWGK